MMISSEFFDPATWYPSQKTDPAVWEGKIYHGRWTSNDGLIQHLYICWNTTETFLGQHCMCEPAMTGLHGRASKNIRRDFSYVGSIRENTWAQTVVVLYNRQRKTRGECTWGIQCDGPRILCEFCASILDGVTHWSVSIRRKNRNRQQVHVRREFPL